MGIDRETAKSIIAKGVAHNDKDLVQMGLAMLEQLSSVAVDAVEVKPAKKRATKKVGGKAPSRAVASEKAMKKNAKSLVEQFTLKKTDDKLRYVPVKGRGINQWVDDQTECIGEEFETPKVRRAARTRPKPELVQVFCGQDENGKMREDGEGCGSEFKMLPHLVRDYFLCDDCLHKKTKGK